MSASHQDLLTLADYLDNEVDEDNFDMAYWENECGTVCCAIGWASKIPSFKQRGLYLSSFGEPVYKNYWGFHAVAKFFNIELTDALNLFSSHSYLINNSKANVISRLRSFANAR